MKIRPEGVEFFRTERRTDVRPYTRTDVTKLNVTFRKISKALTKICPINTGFCSRGASNFTSLYESICLQNATSTFVRLPTIPSLQTFHCLTNKHKLTPASCQKIHRKSILRSPPLSTQILF
jgi:hypothetical protein